MDNEIDKLQQSFWPDAEVYKPAPRTHIALWTARQQQINQQHMAKFATIINMDNNTNPNREGQPISPNSLDMDTYTPRGPEYDHNPDNLIMSRRKFLKVAGLGIASVALGGGLGLILGPSNNSAEKNQSISTSSMGPTETPPPSQSEISSYHVGEGQPKNGEMIISSTESDLRMEMGALLNYVPDGPITYWTTKSGRRRYLITGGDTNNRMGWTKNSTFMIETDGKIPLADMIANHQISQSDIRQVFGYDNSVQYRQDYAGITSVLQDPNDPDHLFGTVHGEQRVNLDAGDSYLATVGLVESSDGGLTWNDKGPFIAGMDPHAPGGIGKFDVPRVSGAGQPTSIFNPADRYAYFSYVDWSFNYQHPDQIYEARAKFNGQLGQLEYWTKNGWSTDFKDLEPIIPVPSKEFVFVALPKYSWSTALNQFQIEGVGDPGFFETYSKDLVHWTSPRVNLDFSTPHVYVDPNAIPRPSATPDMIVSAPNSRLPVGQPWIYYPTPLSEQYPSSAIIGAAGKVYHSIGDNIIPAELAVADFTTQT